MSLFSLSFFIGNSNAQLRKGGDKCASVREVSCKDTEAYAHLRINKQEHANTHSISYKLGRQGAGQEGYTGGGKREGRVGRVGKVDRG